MSETERTQQFEKALEVFSEQCEKLENVNLSIKPNALFFVREALMNLVEISIKQRNPDNELILLIKCERSLEVIDEIENLIIQLSPELKNFFHHSTKS